MHLDGGDSPRSLAIIFSGDKAIIYFCIPQLHIKVPLHPGQCLAVAARILSHYAYQIQGSGSRTVYTFFTDAASVKKAIVAKQKAAEQSM